jgi:hypothetical protein
MLECKKIYLQAPYSTRYLLFVMECRPKVVTLDVRCTVIVLHCTEHADRQFYDPVYETKHGFI